MRRFIRTYRRLATKDESRHCPSSKDSEPLSVYEQLRAEGLTPSLPVLLAALKACSRGRNLQAGTRIHSYVTEAGLESHIFVANTLVDMYAKCGSLAEARRIFDAILQRDLISWNAMIMGYAQSGHGEFALELFQRMQREGFRPNARTFLAAVTACISLAEKEEETQVDGRFVKSLALAKASEVHSQIQTEMDIFVANSLIDLYAHCGSLGDAVKVFERMPCHSPVSWTVLMTGYVDNGEPGMALALFRRMQAQSYFFVDALTFMIALKACTGLAAKEEAQFDGSSKTDSLKAGAAIHLQAEKAGFSSHIYVASTLVDMYAKCGSMPDASRVFERMRVHNAVSWNALISGYVENGEPELALDIFQRFQSLSGDCQPDSTTYVAALKACSCIAAKETGVRVHGKIVKARSLEKGMEVHSGAANRGLALEVHLATTLVNMYTNCGSLVDARSVFDRVASHNVVLWNALILGYAENGDEDLALEVLASLSCAPNALTFVAGLKACASLASKASEMSEEEGKSARLKALEKGRTIHSQAAETGFHLDAFTATALMNMYLKCGSASEACAIFSSGLETLRHNAVALNTLLAGYVDNGEPERALELFHEHVLAGRRRSSSAAADPQSFVAALKACGSSTSVESAGIIHCEACRRGVERNEAVMTALVDCYSKCGMMVKAKQVFDSVPRADVATWNALMAGCSRQGEIQQVLSLFWSMRDEDLRANAITFVCVLTAYSHAGMVEGGKKVLEEMLPRFGVAAGREHYVCLVDALGRVNRLDAAVKMARSMPFEANAVVWRTVLGGCRKWKNLEVGKIAFDRLVELDGNDSAAYSLMASLYKS